MKSYPPTSVFHGSLVWAEICCTQARHSVSVVLRLLKTFKFNVAMSMLWLTHHSKIAAVFLASQRPMLCLYVGCLWSTLSTIDLGYSVKLANQMTSRLKTLSCLVLYETCYCTTKWLRFGLRGQTMLFHLICVLLGGAREEKTVCDRAYDAQDCAFQPLSCYIFYYQWLLCCCWASHCMHCARVHVTKEER